MGRLNVGTCKDCINFRDTGSVIDGYCACWDMFVLLDDTCVDFEEVGIDMKEVKLIVPKETKALTITIMYDDGKQYGIKAKVVDTEALKKGEIVITKE